MRRRRVRSFFSFRGGFPLVSFLSGIVPIFTVRYALNIFAEENTVLHMQESDEER